MWARFITLRDMRSCPPGMVAPLPTLTTPQEHAGADQNEPDHARNDAVFHMHARYAGLMPREKARQLVRGNQEIDRRHNEQDDAEQAQRELHGVSSNGRARFARRPQ